MSITSLHSSPTSQSLSPAVQTHLADEPCSVSQYSLTRVSLAQSNVLSPSQWRFFSPIPLGNYPLKKEELETVATKDSSIWISAAEKVWLDQVGNELLPVVQYTDGVIEVKLKKPGVPVADFFLRATQGNMSEKCGKVETSFAIQSGGKKYLFTSVVSGPGRHFFPVITEVTESLQTGSRGELATVSWKRVPWTDAEALLIANPDLISTALQKSGLQSKWTAEKYLLAIKEGYGNTVDVYGAHQYEPATGYYRYVQNVLLSPGYQWISTTWPVKGTTIAAVKGAALKVAYLTLDEPARAGAKGVNGATVTTMDGSTMSPGE